MLDDALDRQMGAGRAVPEDGTLLEWDGAPSEIQSSGPAFHARTFLVDRVFRRLRPRRLLDIGCGRGYVTVIAAHYAEEVIALDQAPGAVDETRARLAEHPAAQAYVADALTGLWHDQHAGTFDAVLLSEVLEHLDDDAGALAAVLELLAPGGHLVITVPANPALWTHWDDLAGHRRRYRRPELASRLLAAGFAVREIKSWGFPVTGWLAIRGAKMRSRRVARGSATEVGSLVRRVLPLASIVFAALARIESAFSRLDRGAGYVAVAVRPVLAPADARHRRSDPGLG